MIDPRQFLAWWARRLGELVPPGLARLASPHRDAVVVEARGAELLAFLPGRPGGAGFPRTAEGAAALGAAVRGGRRSPPVVLRLAEPEVLRKAIRLPLVAEAGLAQVLAFEMDQETPFTVGELCWDFAVTRRDRAAGRIEVELVLVPRAVVGRLAEIFRAQGLSLVAVEAAGRGGAGPGARPPVALRRGWRDEAAPAPWQGGLVRGLAAANVALALLLAVTPFLRQERAREAVEARLDLARPAFEAATALRRERDRLSETADLLRAERERLPGALEVLRVTTNVLPDGTWLTDFALRGEQLTLTGQSPSAAGIIALLAAAPPLRDPVFTTPITRREGAATEQFTILVLTAPPP